MFRKTEPMSAVAVAILAVADVDTDFADIFPSSYTLYLLKGLGLASGLVACGAGHDQSTSERVTVLTSLQNLSCQKPMDIQNIEYHVALMLAESRS